MFSRVVEKVKNSVLVYAARMAATVRERRRQETTDAILRSARTHLEQAGVEGVTLRAVARDLDIAVSALYRYVDSRDDLLTELLVEAFTEHADAVDAAVDAAGTDDVGAAITAGLRAYRAWSVAHPAQFGLAFGAPVPGYQAPAGRTVAVAVRPGSRIMGLLATAYERGLVDEDVLTARAATLDDGTAAGAGSGYDCRHPRSRWPSTRSSACTDSRSWRSSASSARWSARPTPTTRRC